MNKIKPKEKGGKKDRKGIEKKKKLKETFDGQERNHFFDFIKSRISETKV